MPKSSSSAFARRAPDNITEELVAILSLKGTYEFKPLVELILASLRERNAASGGEEMLRLRCYDKLQTLVSKGVVDRKVNGTVKKYKGVSARLAVLGAEQKVLRKEWNERVRAKLAATQK